MPIPFPFSHPFLHRIPLLPRDPGPNSVLSALTQPSFRREVVFYAVRMLMGPPLTQRSEPVELGFVKKAGTMDTPGW